MDNRAKNREPQRGEVWKEEQIIHLFVKKLSFQEVCTVALYGKLVYRDSGDKLLKVTDSMHVKKNEFILKINNQTTIKQ